MDKRRVADVLAVQLNVDGEAASAFELVGGSVGTITVINGRA